jgi:hypothetical protein
MPRHLDIKLIVIMVLGIAAFGLVILLQNFGLNNIPDENVVYIDATVGGIDEPDLPEAEESAANDEASALELGGK